ncbi:carboxylesterase family protein [Streptomyces angustmyceticus]|nr:carboxylesterase family protein [Streptomyces angustmyceticus]
MAAFGGATTNVTAGGLSSDGLSVCAHLVAPGSRRLFARPGPQRPPAAWPPAPSPRPSRPARCPPPA